VSFVLWASTGFAVASLLRLRRTKPELPRPIRVHVSLPIIYIFCTIFIVGCSIYAEPVDTGNWFYCSISYLEFRELKDLLIELIWIDRYRNPVDTHGRTRLFPVTVFTEKGEGERGYLLGYDRDLSSEGFECDSTGEIGSFAIDSSLRLVRRSCKLLITFYFHNGFTGVDILIGLFLFSLYSMTN